MLLSAKTSRGCRSMPEALKWDSAALTSDLPRLENHQFTFKETSILKINTIISHDWHCVVVLDTSFRCPVKNLKL
ncbi:hypothetical protein N7453_007075 [Penicillium expansum]|nr:hypothetical protein N7453_007075 [Penicillium expansum]